MSKALIRIFLRAFEAQFAPLVETSGMIAVKMNDCQWGPDLLAPQAAQYTQRIVWIYHAIVARVRSR
jgi:hypothetical protein